jgi:hypothetical protein
MRRLLFSILLAGLLAATAGPARAGALVPFTVSPEAITIGALYNGTSLTVTGQVPAGSQVVVRLAGEATTFHMKEKGRVLGVLWMNLDKVAFENAPKVFLVAASKDAPADVVAHLGVPGLAERIGVTAKDGNKAELVAEFLKYQKSEKLYLENAGQVSLGPDVDGARTFTAVLAMPSRLSPGAYAVEVLAVKDKDVIAQGDAAVSASFTGAPAFLADMAFGHGTLYGILASVIAILGGLIIGQIFSGSKSGAH